MEDKKKRFGIIGMGKMGGNLALQALEKGYQVIGFDKSPFRDELQLAAIKQAKKMADLKTFLSAPRIIFIYIPAGKAVDIVIEELVKCLDKGDIIVDGGNSYWGDSIRRAKKIKSSGIELIDCGTSGGIDGARKGACFMVGGNAQAVKLVEPILRDLAVPDGFVHAGPSGSGHFVKLVHNGIEFGMLQAIGEGLALLDHYKDRINIAGTLHCWNHGSVIRSWLIELMEKMYIKEKGLDNIPAYVEDTGEVNWLINDALHFEVPVPVISQSVMQLFTSRDKQMPWAKAIAMMRHGFGGHPFGEDDSLKKERRYGRIGDFYQDEEF